MAPTQKEEAHDNKGLASPQTRNSGYPDIAGFAIRSLHCSPGDAMNDRFAIRIVAVLSPGTVEGSQIDILRMRRGK